MNKVNNNHTKNSNQKQPNFLKRVVIREELFAVTGGTVASIILSQLLYWTRRTYDYDKMLEEEQSSSAQYFKRAGWIYGKSAKVLKNECMIDASERTIRRITTKLVDSGVLEARPSKTPWYSTPDYRINLRGLRKKMDNAGYNVPIWEDVPVDAFRDEPQQPRRTKCPPCGQNVRPQYRDYTESINNTLTRTSTGKYASTGKNDDSNENLYGEGLENSCSGNDKQAEQRKPPIDGPPDNPQLRKAYDILENYGVKGKEALCWRYIDIPTFLEYLAKYVDYLINFEGCNSRPKIIYQKFDNRENMVTKYWEPYLSWMHDQYREPDKIHRNDNQEIVREMCRHVFKDAVDSLDQYETIK